MYIGAMQQFLDVQDVSKLIKRTPGAVRNLVLRRKIPYKKVAGRLLFDMEEIQEWIDNSPGMSLEEIKNGR